MIFPILFTIGQYSGPKKEACHSEHVLGPKSEEETPLIVDREIPNYKIQELIKAGFKPGPQRDAIINILPTELRLPWKPMSKSKLRPALSARSLSSTRLELRNVSPLVGPPIPPYDGAPTASRLLVKRKWTPSACNQ